MGQKVSLLLGVHAHQPVGNFTHVLDDAHTRCYGPFLQVLHRYPEFKFAIHLSGWLLDYMLTHYPQDMRLLREMVQRGQAELFGAGYTEPVLAAIPFRDRVGQIDKLSDYLEQNFGARPHGAWLTERVWESSVVPALGDSSIAYVTVDDYHFLCAGKEGAALNGYFTTEEDGRKLDLFPISEQLRYRLPFSPASDAVTYIESLADESGEAAAVYFDDIEKFGIWPETYAWVYERGWLKDFIEGVLNSDVIVPMRYSDYHAQTATRGVVYLPTTSYIEMNEWTLPVPAAHHYADLVEQEKRNGRYETTKPFVRGGIWRNFFMRYPESNWMHKRMLALSARYHALPEKEKTPAMLHELYEAQANDAYWHGLFGGLYLPHLRRAIYNAIVRLEALLDQVAPRPERDQQDVDLDGCDELLLQNGVLQAIVKLDGSASICEFDTYKLAHNFGDTLARQTEHYHRKVNASQPEQHGGEGISNPHERMSCKQEILPEDLATDAHGLTLFRDSWAENADAEFGDVLYDAPKAGKAATAVFSGRHDAITKQIALKDSALKASYKLDGMSGIFRVRINLAMPSCDGPAGRFRVDGKIPGGFGQPLQLAAMKNLRLEDEVLGGIVSLTSSVPCQLATWPHFSVSQSEAGFEKIMQAVALELIWPADTLTKGVDITLEVI
ncbi:MAG: DUF1926 domain-containing protein [Methylobacillus sp.]|jgi:alpha-amylase/alpha-mannosidase (GH57 family)|nr:DUF1926 domain-containing protein [Methylobacillus sp.]